MKNLKPLFLAAFIAVSIFALAAADSAQAGHKDWSISIGHGGIGFSRGHGHGHGHGGFHGGFHGGHFDWHPGSYVRHGCHWDYVPGHWDWHGHRFHR